MVTKALNKATGKAAETAGTAGKTARGATGGDLGELTDALHGLGHAALGRLTTLLMKGITSTTGRLTDFAEGGGGSLLEAATGGGSGVKGKAMAGAVKGGLSAIMQKVKDKFTGGGGKGDKIKLTNIVEEIDIGAPVELVYDQWTQFTQFPSFMKKVESVEQISDEKTAWKAQTFWSHRSWEATTLEQVPYERIVWRSKGQKGHVDGAVTFHELTPDLTKVVLVLAYHPQGLFERTGNIWRAQGRRVRLELKHFRRQVMTESLLKPDDVEGWHGEIRDGRVVEHGSDDVESEQDEDEDNRDPEDEEPDRRSTDGNRGGKR